MSNTYSADFDRASSQVLNIDDSAQTGLDLSTDYSIEAWINLDQLPSTAGGAFNMVAKYYANGGNFRAYIFYLDSSDKLNAIFSDDGTYTSHASHLQSTSAAVTSNDVGKWVHLAVTVDISGGSGGMTFYRNGETVAGTSLQNSATSIANTDADFCIGCQGRDGGFSTPYFDGQIDDVRIWSDIRTAEEIQQNMWRNLVGNEANLVGCWQLENSLLDQTANNNDLTNNNSATFVADVPFIGIKPYGIDTLTIKKIKATDAYKLAKINGSR